ncbi:MAG TPA: GNAT family N-acetyltransferase [Candidatus Acidoferrales bacterium]|nr:GNAT family N-acetyltransferase [Candidatus Acidoferrales bacterium]
MQAFLAQRLQSSFILVANLTADGFAYEGRPYQGIYVGAFDGDELAGVAAHYWNDNLIFQAPRYAAELGAAALRESARPCAGLVGPWDQIALARTALGFQERPTRYDSKEILYGVELAHLRTPENLNSGSVTCRRAVPEDLPVLTSLALDDTFETFGDAQTPERRIKIRDALERDIAQGLLFILDAGGSVVAKSSFHGIANGAVQIGGVYTPPALRGRGYARSVVAGSLLMAREAGESKAFLFTNEKNVAARRAYEALGFRPIGDYGIILFR